MKPFRFLSVCSGMEAASVAWEPLGWKAVGFSEIEPFPCAILAHRFPTIPNYGSLTNHQTWPIEPGSINLLVGGTPCQSFSVAGLRKGLADPRGNLALVFLGLADRVKPEWIVWENVPGVLSSNGGRDFGSFLGALAQLGYGFAFRVLDAVHFGVPQRRRRVFVVACLGVRGWERSAKVLFESEGLRGDIASGGNEGQEIAPDIKGGVNAFRKSRRDQFKGDFETWIDDGKANTLNTFDLTSDVRTTHAVVNQQLYENRPNDSRITGPLKVAPTVISRFGTGGGNVPLVNNEVEAIAFQPGNLRREAGAEPSEHSFTTLKASSGDQSPHIATPLTVRRLTPRECERLQGFPDDWSLIPWKGKPADQCPDGPRYKACGNSMAVPVMRWIGSRIAQVEQLSQPPHK